MKFSLRMNPVVFQLISNCVPCTLKMKPFHYSSWWLQLLFLFALLFVVFHLISFSYFSLLISLWRNSEIAVFFYTSLLLRRLHKLTKETMCSRRIMIINKKTLWYVSLLHFYSASNLHKQKITTTSLLLTTQRVLDGIMHRNNGPKW